jgi:hypothetical protein
LPNPSSRPSDPESALSESPGRPAGTDVLSLARAGTELARERLRGFSPESIAGAVTDLVPRERAEFLELAERVEEIVPHLPETAFASTVCTVGLADAGWLVEFASKEQRVAAVDLDCWKDGRFSSSRLFEWIDAMIQAGPETLVAAFDELDPEVWVLGLKEMADFSIAEGQAAGDLGLSFDGFVCVDPHSSEGEERVHEILSTAQERSPSHYYRFVYGAMLESQRECEEFGRRWQRGRLNDLGFPDRTDAMGAYRPLPVDAAPPVPEVVEQAADAVVAAPPPLAQLAGTLLGQALAELAPERAAEILRSLLGLANALAVADELPLTEDESVQASIGKAVRGIQRGLAELARVRGRSPSAVLDAVPPLEVFRVGVACDASLRPPKTLSDLDAEAARHDWNVAEEEIDEGDRTLGSDGRLR